MKILFIADHHIKLGQKNVPKQWAKDRYDRLWDRVYEEAYGNECTWIIHGGDIFDSVPSMEEIDVFFNMVKSLEEFNQIIFPGNHEAQGKTTSWLTHFKEAVKPFNAVIVDEWSPGYLPGVDILPYNELKKKKWHGHKGDMLFTHVRGDIPPHVTAEIDLELFSTWDVVFAGDLHAHSNSQKNIVYPGSPVTTSFHRTRSKGENGIIIVDTVLKEYEYIALDMPQLIRKTVESPEDMVETEYDRTVYELVGDMKELTAKVDKDLLDKKITKRTSEATLNLHNKTLAEELYEYLVNVENIANPQDIIQEFHDSIEASTL